MKTMKNLIAILLLSIGLQQVSASNLKIRTVGNESVVIEVQKASTDESIKIFDKTGNLLFFEDIDKENYLKTFKMSDLPLGEYHLIYENKSKKELAIIVKNEEGMLITSDFSQISFKPMLNQKENFLSIGFTNPNYEKVSITISDSFGNELVEIKGIKDLIVRKTFNTDKLPKGDYFIELQCGSESYSKLVTIK